MHVVYIYLDTMKHLDKSMEFITNELSPNLWHPSEVRVLLRAEGFINP